MQETTPAIQDTPRSSTSTRSVLAGEVASFLVQFSIYLHQQAAYPANHPILTSSASSAAIRLASLMLDRESFAIGVAADRLVIDGVSTDPNHSVLRELAEQLHRQQLGVVRFWRGVGPQELEDLVASMAAARVADRPLGLTLESAPRRWAHIQLERHAYDQLVMAGEEDNGTGTEKAAPTEASPATMIWRALAARALSLDGAEAAPPGVTQVAQAIEARKDDAEYDRVIVEYLLQLGRETTRSRSSTGDERAVSGEFQELLRSVPPDTLRQLLQLGATLEQRRELMELAATDLPVSTVLLILKAAAAESGQSISDNLLRILGKFSLQAEDGGPQVRPAAEAALRASVRRLLDQWTLTDPNPDSHTRALDQLARSVAPAESTAEATGSAALRVIQMSLEVRVAGAMLTSAIDELIARGELATLIDLLRGAETSAAASAAWDHLATPQALEQLLSGEDIDSETVESLLSRLGTRAAAPMLETLANANSRTVRRRLLNWLRLLGEDIVPLVVERLPDSPWYVQRNLLGLLGSMPDALAGFSALPYATHSDARVRREAFKILLRNPEHYDESVLRAIRDEDPQIVGLGLTMAVERFPPTAGPTIVATLSRREWPSELRVQAIRALVLSTSPQIGRWLVEQTLAKQRWFRRRKLAPPTPEVVAAVSVLAANWSRDAAAAEVLELARASRDDVIRAAATTPEKR